MKKSCMPYVVIELKSFLNDLDMHDFFFFFLETRYARFLLSNV